MQNGTVHVIYDDGIHIDVKLQQEKVVTLTHMMNIELTPLFFCTSYRGAGHLHPLSCKQEQEQFSNKKISKNFLCGTESNRITTSQMIY